MVPRAQTFAGKYTNHLVVLNVGTGASSWFDGATTYYTSTSATSRRETQATSQFRHQPNSSTLYGCDFTLLSLGITFIFGDSSTAWCVYPGVFHRTLGSSCVHRTRHLPW